MSLPVCSSAISSSTGATSRHGMHHSAQKSDDDRTVGPQHVVLERGIGDNDSVPGHDPSLTVIGTPAS
jgi:hypothetical protein